MTVSAIICEYNPMHNGHMYQLVQTRVQTGCDVTVALMSGNFVQRGEPALYEKHLRAQAAVACGVNLVLELPALFTLQSAERYAAHAVRTLAALSCVDFLSFGAECGDLALLRGIAHLLAEEPADFRQGLKAALAEGLSFPLARCRAVAQTLGPAAAEVLKHPNNILAVEYLKALLRQQAPIQPLAIRRTGTGHDSPEAAGRFASASHLRQLLNAGQSDTAYAYMPAQAAAYIREAPQAHAERLEPAILAHLCRLSATELGETADMSEGLENKIRAAAYTADTCKALAEQAKSKRYPLSRIRRLLLNAYLGITKADLDKTPQYLKILAFDAAGQSLLNQIKKKTALPLAKNRNQIKGIPAAETLWDRELWFDRVYALALQEETE